MHNYLIKHSALKIQHYFLIIFAFVVKLFLSNRSIVQFLLPLVTAVYVLLNYYTQYFHYSEVSNFGFWGNRIQLHVVPSQIIACILIITNGVGINAIFNWNQFLERNSFMPSLLYVVLMSFYHSFYEVDGLLLSHTFLIITLYQLYFLRQNEDGRKIVFNASFFAGLAATFHPPLIGLLPFLFFMIWNIRPFVFREIILSIIGFGVPLLYAGFYLIYSGTSIDMELFKKSTNYNYDKQQFDFLVTSGIFICSLLLSLVSIQAHIQKSSIRLKKMTRMLWWFVIIGLAIGVIDYILYKQIQRFSLIMIPFSFFLTFSFSHKTLSSVAIGLFYVTLTYSFLKFFL